jgi:hypothetical protein
MEHANLRAVGFVSSRGPMCNISRVCTHVVSWADQESSHSITERTVQASQMKWGHCLMHSLRSIEAPIGGEPVLEGQSNMVIVRIIANMAGPSNGKPWRVNLQQVSHDKELEIGRGQAVYVRNLLPVPSMSAGWDRSVQPEIGKLVHVTGNM